MHPNDISLSILTVQKQQGRLTRTLVSKHVTSDVNLPAASAKILHPCRGLRRTAYATPSHASVGEVVANDRRSEFRMSGK